MQTHNIKLSYLFADAVNEGLKTFEIRENDRGYQTGDRVIFTVIDRRGVTMPHPVSRKAYVITYLLHGWGLKEGYCVFGIKPWADQEWAVKSNG